MRLLPSQYGDLPPRFFSSSAPVPVGRPRLIRFNHSLAAQLSIDVAGLDDAALADIFSGNRLPDGATPMALAYAGHQFGHFVPQLGDGRAILLGDAIDWDGSRRDIQLKGSGRSVYSRGGDGRAALGPVLREYAVSEAMHALGIPTTRSLAAVLTGESVLRERSLPGAVLTRVAASHVRVGTFEYFAAREDGDAVRLLADYVIERHYPEAKTHARPYLRLLECVIERQARLVARWMLVGFIHGVMNTDNMSVAGETIDYGPCAFLDAYDPATVFSSIDARGRYGFANQPQAAIWNLSRFAETLLSLIDTVDEAAIASAQAALAEFSKQFSYNWLSGMRRKLGLNMEHADDAGLVNGLLDAMRQSQADFTLTFRALCSAADSSSADASVRLLFNEPAAYDAWVTLWRERLKLEDAGSESEARGRGQAMRSVNPQFIPRNHRIEQLIEAAVERNDFTPFETFMRVLADPFRSDEQLSAYAAAPTETERVLQTFCGT